MRIAVSIPETNTPAINAFTASGFNRAAMIPNMVKDRENMPVDVVVMMKDVRPARDDANDYDF